MLCRETNGDLSLKPNHVYHSQIRGLVAKSGVTLLHILVKTFIYIQRITYDRQFWEDELLPKLCSLYNLCLAPETVCPQHPLDLPLRHLRNE